MKTKKVKSLKLTKTSIANLEKAKTFEIKGGATGLTDCKSFTSLCVTSCHSH